MVLNAVKWSLEELKSLSVQSFFHLQRLKDCKYKEYVSVLITLEFAYADSIDWSLTSNLCINLIKVTRVFIHFLHFAASQNPLKQNWLHFPDFVRRPFSIEFFFFFFPFSFGWWLLCLKLLLVKPDIFQRALFSMFWCTWQTPHSLPAPHLTTFPRSLSPLSLSVVLSLHCHSIYKFQNTLDI